MLCDRDIDALSADCINSVCRAIETINTVRRTLMEPSVYDALMVAVEETEQDINKAIAENTIVETDTLDKILLLL